MNNPSFVSGSIFGSGQASQPTAATQPDRSSRGRNSSPNRGSRGRGGKPNQRGRPFTTPPQNTTQASQNVRSSGDVAINRGSIFGAHPSSSPRKAPKIQSGGVSMFNSQPGTNPRRSFRPESKVVANTEFMTWSKNDNPDSSQSKLMNRAQQAVAQQFGRGQSDQPNREFPPRGRGGRGSRGQSFRSRGRGGREPRPPSSHSSRDDMDISFQTHENEVIHHDFKSKPQGFQKFQKPGQTNKYKKVWRFFQFGECKKGDQCEFEHVKADQSPSKFHKTWYKVNPHQNEERDQSMASHTRTAPIAEDEVDEESQEAEDEEEEEDESFENVKNPTEVSVRVPFSDTTSNVESSQPRNLRSLLDKIKRNKPTQPEPVEEEKHPIETSDDDQGNNSDTFGDPKLSIFPRKRGSRVIGIKQTKIDLDEWTSIQEVPIAESDVSDELDDNESVEAPIIVPIKISQTLNKASNKDSFSQIKAMIAKCKSEKAQGIYPKIETNKAKLLKMCDESEAYKRQEARDLSIFEMDPANTDLSVIDRDNPPQVLIERAVKAYKRSAADIKLDDPLTIRPLEIIELVLDYLLDVIADADITFKGDKNIFASEPAKKDLFVFIFDRTRAIRQELTIIHEPKNRIAIQVLEKIARFHWLAANEALGIDGIDFKQNNEQFTSTLTTMRESYDLINSILYDPESPYKGPINDEFYKSPDEGEFRAYMILTQISDQLEVFETLKSLPPDVANSKYVKLATKFAFAYQNRDIQQYFKLFKSAPYLISCCWVYSISEMRKRALQIYNTSLKAIVTDPSTQKMTAKPQINLGFLTEMLCFNNEIETKAYLHTLGYMAIKHPITQVSQVIKSGEGGEVWKPRTNHKYIESKKSNNSVLESRCDIIKGISCTIHQGRPKIPTRILERIKKPTVAQPIAPPKEEIKKVVETEVQKGPTIEEMKEAERKRREAIEIQIAEERKRVEAEKKRKQDLENQRIKEAERIRKENEERERIAKLKAEEERRKKELAQKRHLFTMKMIKKQNLAIMKLHFFKLKRYHMFWKQNQKLSEALKFDLWSKPAKGYSKAKDHIWFDNVEKAPYKPIEKFTDVIENYIASALFSRDTLEANSNNIHFRITCFLTKPESESRSSSIFNNWLIKTLTNHKKSLNTVTSKYLELSPQASQCIIFCKNMNLSQTENICYTLNVHYDYEPEVPKANVFYNEFMSGANIIICTLSSPTCYNNFKEIVKQTYENAQKVLVVYNLSKLTKVKNSEIKKFISDNSIHKFIQTDVIDANIPDDEGKLEKLVTKNKYYFPHRSVTASPLLLSHNDVWYSKASTVFNYDTTLRIVIEIMGDLEIDVADEVSSELKFVDLVSFRKLQNMLRSDSLDSIDYKISTLNRILELMYENFKEGIKYWSLMDPKYYGNHEPIVKHCLRQIPLVNRLLADSKIFKIDYFGKVPFDKNQTTEWKLLISKYYSKYFKKLSKLFDDDFDSEWNMLKIQSRMATIDRNNFGTGHTIEFNTILKLVENAIRHKHISWVYRLEPERFNLVQLIKRLNPVQILENAEKFGMFDVMEKWNKWKFDAKYNICPSLKDQNWLRKRELKDIRLAEEKLKAIKPEPKRSKILFNPPNVIEPQTHKKPKIDELEYLSVSSESELSSEPTDDYLLSNDFEIGSSNKSFKKSNNIAEIQSSLKQIRSYIRLIDSKYL